MMCFPVLSIYWFVFLSLWYNNQLAETWNLLKLDKPFY